MTHRVKWFSRVRVSSAACLLAGGCALSVDQAVDNLDSVAVVESALTSRQPAPGASGEITLQTVANAQCTVTSTSSGRGMPVVADDSGLVHLWAASTAASETYTLDCEDTRSSTRIKFDLKDSATFVPALPRATAAASTPKRIRPALRDPESMTQEALTKAGYPPHPDPKSALYAKWLSAVTTPTEVLAPRLIQRTDVNFDPVTNFNSARWDGIAQTAQTRYSLSVAGFTIPSFSPILHSSNAGMWTGVGGVTGELIQDGIFYSSIEKVGTYKPFFEYAPAPPVFPNFVVGAGDSMIIAVWEGDSTCTFGLRFGFGCFYIQDISRGSTFTAMVADPGNSFVGESCEGVIERQASSKLAKWSGSPQMQVDCYDAVGGFHNFSLSPYLKVTMVNNFSDVLATSSVVASDLLDFTWHQSD